MVWPPEPYSPECVEGKFCELCRDGVLRSTHGPGPMLAIPTDALWALLEQPLRTEAAPTAGSATFREQMLTSVGRRPERAHLLALTGRRAPGALAPQEDDPGGCEAQLNPLGGAPAFVPARIAADLWVEPDAGTCRLQYALVGGELPRIVERRSPRAAVDGVARAERLHRRRACSEGAGDPLVALALLDPTADVVYELP